MRHVGNLLLAVVDRLDDAGGEVLEELGELVFFGRGFAGLGAGFGGGGDGAVWVEAAKGAVAFLEDAVAFFQEGLDFVDEFFFVELVLGSAVGGFDGLGVLLAIGF